MPIYLAVKGHFSTHSLLESTVNLSQLFLHLKTPSITFSIKLYPTSQFSTHIFFELILNLLLSLQFCGEEHCPS